MPDITRRNFRRYDKDEGQAGLLFPANTTLAVATSSRAYGRRYVPSRPMTIIGLSFATTVVASADDEIDVGIYNSTLTTRLASAGATTGKINASTGVKTLNFTAPVTLQAGVVYYAAISRGVQGGTGPTMIAEGRGSADGWKQFGATVPQMEGWVATVSPHPLPADLSAALSASGTVSVPSLALLEA